MKLLIKDNKELIPHLPMLDSSITFARLSQDLLLATEKIIKIIGNEMYNHIIGLYENSNRTDADNYLISVVAYPIAVDAYRKYVVQNDVAHTNEGRKARLNEYEKMPFEWLLDRDNKASEKKYYKGIDRMIEYLDNNNPNNWKSTEQYKNSHNSLFRTTAEFDEYFSIESRYLLMKLAPGIKKCIDEEIIPRITQLIWNSLITELTDSKAISDVVSLSKIKKTCAYYALSWGVLRMSATLFPEGVMEKYIEVRMQIPEVKSIGVVAKLFENDYEKTLLEIESHIAPVIPESDERLDIDALINISDNSKIVNL